MHKNLTASVFYYFYLHISCSNQSPDLVNDETDTNYLQVPPGRLNATIHEPAWRH